MKSVLFKIAIFFTFIVLLGGWPPLQAQSSTGPQIAFSAFSKGQWDIFSVSPTGDLRRLTNTPAEDADPAFSPDGTRLAYASRRENNWDIYLLDLRTGVETRLTDHPHYDGAPAWKPNGQTLAFESFRNGDLDIWLLDLAPGSSPRNLTAESVAGDFSPAWDDSGQRLFFSSWRSGNNDLWVIEPDSGKLNVLTTSPASDTGATWDAAGAQLGFIRNNLGDQDVWVLDPAGMETQLSWLGSLQSFTFSPDGASVAGIFKKHDGAQIVRLDSGQAVPVYLTGVALIQGKLSWCADAVLSGQSADLIGPADPSPLYEETLTPSGSATGEPYDLVKVDGLIASGDPWLADTVDDSFQALRARVYGEAGYDFLGEVSESLRGLNFFSDVSQYSSWHKSGRAVDTLFDLPGNRLEIVREDIGNETYWRILLRCDDQSGACGRPITANAWDYSAKARTEIAPEQGGIEKPNLLGYYIDFTTLAEMYGWERISAYDDEDFSWTWHFKAFEYWHYQKKLKDHNGVSNWYQAMLQVHPQESVDAYFTWEQMRAAGEDPYLVALKGVPLPPPAARWWRQLSDSRQ